jgi:tetratricopeptide (TPR) repeat protein
MTAQGEQNPRPAAGRRRRLLLVVVALAGWAGGFLAVLEWKILRAPPEKALSLEEIAGLSLPVASPDVSPQYHALVEELRQAVDQLVRSSPTDVRAVTALARLHNLAHDDAGEVACWRRCLELDPRYLPAYTVLATRSMNKGEYQEAEALLREALTISGGMPSIAELLASVLSRQGKFQETVGVLEPVLAAGRGTAEAHAELGEAYLKLKEFAKAKEQFQKAIQESASLARAAHGLAQAAERLGQTQEAARWRTELVRLKQLDNQARQNSLRSVADERVVPRLAAEILTTAAAVYRSRQERQAEEQCLRRAAELEPNDVACRAALAELLRTEERLEEALGTVDELRRIEPANLEHLKNAGILQVRSGHWDAAQKIFQELCDRAPDSAVGYAGLAESLFRAGQDLPRARKLAAKAVELEPSARNYSFLGAICERQGDLDFARSALKQAVLRAPDDPRYRKMYASLGGKE